MAENKKSYQREKIPLKKGFTLMDWNRLCNSGEDLTGTRGALLRIPLSEVKKHRTEDDAWMVLNGRVFNVTRYMDFHPGGTKKLMQGVGRDCTRLFNLTHAWVNWESLLAKCYIGIVIPESEHVPDHAEPDNDDDDDHELTLEEEKAATMFPAPEGPQRAAGSAM